MAKPRPVPAPRRRSRLSVFRTTASRVGSRFGIGDPDLVLWGEGAFSGSALPQICAPRAAEAASPGPIANRLTLVGQAPAPLAGRLPGLR